MLDRNSLILADGAMGTYVAMLGGRDCACELNNILNPNKIKQIHSEYIAAGAKLIRTNTFSANTYLLNDSWDKVAQVIAAGFSIAKSVAGLQDIIIAADIGPIPSELRQEEIYDEYKKIVDLFFEQGADTFLFETFSSTDYLDEIAAYIKGKSATATVITSFSLTPDGVTKNGTSAQELIDWKLSVPQIDILGFNCGSGPAHMRKTLNALQTKGCRLSLMPNAGYAQVNIDSGISYANHADYFARTLIDMINADTVIVGGCCGTTPEHICRISKILSRNYNKSRAKAVTEAESPSAVKPKENIIKNKLSNREFIITVEVEPPKDSDASRVLAASFDLKRAGVDAVTVPDSPLARMRMDSLALAACIIQEIGMPAIPHITCRDKNINAIQSGVLAAHYLGIRNVLAVTGDSISNAAMVKPVFNVSSFGLVQLLNSLNEKYFKGDEISLYGAVNVNAANFEKELDRASIKVNHGAEALFTQPIHSQKGIEALKILKKAGLAKTIAGLMPIVSKRNALFLAHEFPGFLIPEDIISRFSDDMSAECNEKTALDITVDIAKQIRDYSDGFYIIVPFARTSLIIKLIERLKRCGII